MHRWGGGGALVKAVMNLLVPQSAGNFLRRCWSVGPLGRPLLHGLSLESQRFTAMSINTQNYNSVWFNVYNFGEKAGRHKILVASIS
jgi:hypothetical protein